MSAETDEIAEAERMQQWGKVAFLRGQLGPLIYEAPADVPVLLVDENLKIIGELLIEDTAPAAPVLDETELN